MSFNARDLTVKLIPGAEGPGLFACNACDSTAEKPECAPPSQCQEPSAEEPKQVAVGLDALDFALLRGQLRESLHRLQ